MDMWIVASYMKGGQKWLLGVRPYLTADDGWFFAVFERPYWAVHWRTTGLNGYSTDVDALSDVEVVFGSEPGFELTESAKKVIESNRATHK